jgi:hypothetical protein
VRLLRNSLDFSAAAVVTLDARRRVSWNRHSSAKPASFKLHFDCLSTRESLYDNTFGDDYSPLNAVVFMYRRRSVGR